MSSGVNISTNSLKASDTTKREFFELIFYHTDQKIWRKYYQAGLNSVLDALACWVSIRVLTLGFLSI